MVELEDFELHFPSQIGSFKGIRLDSAVQELLDFFDDVKMWRFRIYQHSRDSFNFKFEKFLKKIEEHESIFIRQCAAWSGALGLGRVKTIVWPY